MMGLIGWSVALPTVLGALLGLWLDKRHTGQHAWTLALLVALGRQRRQDHSRRTGLAMTGLPTLLLSWLAGGMLGAMFFGGLWWTVRKGVSAGHPALWFLGSLLLRVSVTVAGFYFVSNGHWQRLLVCLLGFVAARRVVMWRTRSGASQPQPGHAP
jgi:F1F0 ATPase subunit 2